MPKVTKVETEVEVKPTENGGVMKRLKENLMGTDAQNAEADARLKRYSEGEGFLPMVERVIRGGINTPFGAITDKERATLNKKTGGSVKKTESKGKDWHGFGHSKTGSCKY